VKRTKKAADAIERDQRRPKRKQAEANSTARGETAVATRDDENTA
jgi:hypothetical protein